MARTLNALKPLEQSVMLSPVRRFINLENRTMPRKRVQLSRSALPRIPHVAAMPRFFPHRSDESRVVN